MFFIFLAGALLFSSVIYPLSAKEVEKGPDSSIPVISSIIDTLQYTLKDTLKYKTISSLESIKDTAGNSQPTGVNKKSARDPLPQSLNASDIGDSSATIGRDLVFPIPGNADPYAGRIFLTDNEIISKLAGYHRVLGIFKIAGGAFGVLGGVALLDKADYTAFAISMMSLGGISISLGIWEMKFGAQFLQKSLPRK